LHPGYTGAERGLAAKSNFGSDSWEAMMKPKHVRAIALVLAIWGTTSCYGDLIVQKDGSVLEGKILSRDAKGLSMQVEGKTPPPPAMAVPADKIAKVIQIDEHGAETATAGGVGVPAKRADRTWKVPPEPAAPPIAAASTVPTYYVIPLHGAVGETYLADMLEKSLADAEKRKPTVVVLDIASPGGLVDEAQLIVKTLHKYNKTLRIVALLDQSLSASAIVSLSAPTIYMKSTGTIGAATAFDGSNPDLPRDIQEKFQSAWRAVARNSAEEGGHEPLLAEAMIDNNMSLHLETVDGKKVVKEGPGATMLTRPGRILTLTSREAVGCGLAAGVADDFDELGEAMNLKGWRECPGLGKLLVDYIPKRHEAFEQKFKEIEGDFKTSVSAAVAVAPWEGQHIGSYSGLGGLGSRIVVQSRSLTPAQKSKWKSDSLAAVIAFQKAEQNLRDEISLATAFGQKGVAEELKEPLSDIAGVRARIYSDRNRYADEPFVATAGTAPPLTLKNAPLSAKFAETIKQVIAGKKYQPGEAPQGALYRDTTEDLAPDGGLLIGLRCGLESMPTGQMITSLQPIYLTPKGVVLGKLLGNPDASPVTDLVARDGYAVGGAKISGTGTISGVQLQFVRIGDGKLDPADTYDSETAGKMDRPVSVTSTQPTIGIICRTINEFCAAFTLLSVTPPDAGPMASAPAPSAAPATRPQPPVVASNLPPRMPVTPGATPPRPAARNTPITASTAPPLALKNAPLEAKFAASLRLAIEKKNTKAGQSNINAAITDAESDLAPHGGLLIGFRCGMTHWPAGDVVSSLQAVYLTESGVVVGSIQGNPNATPVIDLVARDGYAVGGAKADGAGRINGLQLRFVRIADGWLDGTDAYESDPIGKIEKPTLLGSAMPIVGFSARVLNPLTLAISFISVAAPEARPLSTLRAGAGQVSPLSSAFAEVVKDVAAKKAYLVGGSAGSMGAKSEFAELAPDGGILVGFECGKIRNGSTESITSIRPIFLTEHGEVKGAIHGESAADLAVVKAPPGYAVGAVKVGNAVSMDQLTVTFMKIGDRRLLPEDAYVASKIGTGGNTVRDPALPPREVTFGGDGTPVIGIAGKVDPGKVALGLIFLSPTEVAKGSH
jgi:hypothetical protein